MVRTKNGPTKHPEPIFSVINIVGELITHCAAEQYEKMVVTKCHKCEMTMNKKGEKRPGIKCKQCKTEHCYACAELTIEVCEAVRCMEKGFWTCNGCETKSTDMKAVLESMNSIKTELCTIKEGQAEQQAEREQVLEGLKSVEAVVKRMEGIEKTQVEQGERLLEQEANTKKHEEKIDKTEERTTALEKRLEKMESGAVNVMQTNAIIRELREIEKGEKKLIIANLPESKEEDASERKKEDEKRVSDVFKELKVEHCKPLNVIRVGFGGRFPKKVLVILRSVEDAEKILQSAEKTTLPNSIWLARDRTWNQREEGRLRRDEAGRQMDETAAAVPKRGRPPGSGKGPSRPKKTGGSVRGRGSRNESHDSRKRQRSGDEDEDNQRRKSERGGEGGGAGRGRGASSSSSTAKETVGLPRARNEADKSQLSPSAHRTREASGTPEVSSSLLQKVSDRPGTPRSGSGSILGAAGGQDENF